MIIRPIFCEDQSHDPHSRGSDDALAFLPLPLTGTGSRAVIVEVEPIDGYRAFQVVGYVYYVNGKVVTQERYEEKFREMGIDIPRASPYARGGETLVSSSEIMRRELQPEKQFIENLIERKPEALRTLERYSDYATKVADE